MVKVNFFGLMVEDIVDIINKVKNMEKVHSIGLMVIYVKVLGIMVFKNKKNLLEILKILIFQMRIKMD